MNLGNILKSLSAILVGGTMLLGSIAEAGIVTDRFPIQMYAESQLNTYSSIGAAKRAGWADGGTDLIKVYQYSGGWLKVTHPGSGGKTVTRWCKSNELFADPNYSNRGVNVRGAQTVYRTSTSGTKFGSVSNNEGVIVLGEKNGRAQILYTLNNGGGYKVGWVSASAVASSPAPSSNDTELRYPLNNIYVCGNNWMTKYSKRPSRPYHAGIDVKSSSGDRTIYSAAAGTVAATGWNNENGYFVIIQHAISGRTIYSFYCHMSKISVTKGVSVKCGTPIGVIGNTGSASKGEHLHFTFVDKLMSSGGYWGYVTSTGNVVSYNGYTFYSPAYVIDNKRLP